MATVTLAGGGRFIPNVARYTFGSENDHITVLGEGNTTIGNTTVNSGGGDDFVNLRGSGVVNAGTGNDTIIVGGRGTVDTGLGNDSVVMRAQGVVSNGGGNDTISMTTGTVRASGIGDNLVSFSGPGGSFLRTGPGGNDTITLGSQGSYNIFEPGTATVTGAFGAATISGGQLLSTNAPGLVRVAAPSGNATIVGNSTNGEIIGGSGAVVMDGGTGLDTLIGGVGSTTMTGGAGADLFRFNSTASGGAHLITDFVQGVDHVRLQGYNVANVLAQNVTYSSGNAFITLDGGATVIEIQGVSLLTNTDFG